MKNNVEIINISEKVLVGKKVKMSLVNDKTFVLWKNFKSQISRIKNRVDNKFYSIQLYSSDLDFKDFNSDTIFENCAAVEIYDSSEILEGMELFNITKGKYAVFTYMGIAAEAVKITRYIYEEWLPNSNFQLDNRPHFQVMDSNYKPDDPKAKETFWVPIQYIDN